LTQLELVIPLRGTDPGPDGRRLDPALSTWRTAVTASADACLLLAADTRIVAISRAARQVLGFGPEIEIAMPRFLDAGIRFLDFTAGAHPLVDSELARLAPVQALQTDALERSLMRIEHRGVHRTFDVTASPLHSPPRLDAIGSLAFLNPIGPT
jgi:PAS domain-containing protein